MATTEALDVVMPQMGVSVSEGTITKWLKQQGEQVEADEPLLEISTDKVDTEVPSPGSGLLTEILVQEGETVDVGTKLAVIGGAGVTAPSPGSAARARDAGCRRRVDGRCERRRRSRRALATSSAGACPGRADERQDVRLTGGGQDRLRARR